jgi:hypothetical protein
VFLFENVKGRKHMEDISVDRKVILEWMLWKKGGKVFNGCI